MVNTINVTGIDDAIKKIEKNGGRIMVRKMEVPMQGTLAYFVDSEGNTHGIMQPLPNLEM